MRKLLAILLCFTSISLVACTNETSSSESVSSLPAVSSAVSVQSEIVEVAVNTELFSLIGEKNAVIRPQYSQDCYAEITEMGAARLSYFEPYISYTFVMLEPSRDSWMDPSSDGVFSENPFVDDLEIMQIELEADYDAESKTITDQGSLAQLFETDAEITYSLICDTLEQTPELAETIFFSSPIEPLVSRSVADTTAVEITGYAANFTIEEKPVVVTFVKNGEKYVAYSITIGEVSAETQSLPQTESSTSNSSQSTTQSQSSSQSTTSSQGNTAANGMTPKKVN